MTAYTSGTVNKALDIVDRLTDSAGDLTITELAGLTGIHKSTVVRLCATLEGRGMVSRAPGGGYRLGPRVRDMARAYEGRFNLEDVVRPVLRQLREETGESASFYVPDGDMRVCLYRESSRHAIRHHVDEGSRLPYRDGVVGRVLLAFMGEPGASFDEIRRAGYLIDDGREPYTASVAAPVLSRREALHGALVVSGPSSRFDAPARRQASAQITEAAQRLAATLPDIDAASGRVFAA